MAKTAATGFYPRGNLLGGENTVPSIDYIIDNSATLAIGDAVRINTAGYVVRAGVGVATCGIVVGLVDQFGTNVFSPRASGVTGATLSPDDTIATSATNTTNLTRLLKAQVQFDPGGIMLWYNQADAALAQTNLLQFFDCNAASNQITQASASDTSGTFQLIKLDPDGDGTTTKGLFRIVENELVTAVNVYNTTPVVVA